MFKVGDVVILKSHGGHYAAKPMATGMVTKVYGDGNICIEWDRSNKRHCNQSDGGYWSQSFDLLAAAEEGIDTKTAASYYHAITDGQLS
jgi:hypothetical protein